MRLIFRGSLALSLACCGFAGGCATATSFYDRLVGNTEPQQVRPDQFAQPQQATGPNPVDQPGQVNSANGTLGESFQPVLQPLPAPSSGNPQHGLDKTLSNAEPPLAVGPATRPTAGATQPSETLTSNIGATPAAAPTTAPAQTLSSGQYLPMGGVVAEVNGTPIYVNKVLRLVWPTLKNDASQMDRDHFALAAKDIIERQIQNLVKDELIFAAAQRSLDDSDKKLVAALTAQYRQQQITAAGGSIEVARRNAAAIGDDFDQKVNDKYREFMNTIYNQRKFVPLIEPSAADMRRFYQENVDKLFTEHSEANFDLIGITPALLGGATEADNRKLAFDKAKQAHDRAAAGETFTTLFAEFNNDPGLSALTNATGNVGAIERGSFSVKEIEDAVWQLQPGKVGDVVQVNGELYIVKMESRKEGAIKPFENQDVQNQISNSIRQQRYRQLEDAEYEKFLSQAIVRSQDEMLETAVDMAVQNYSVWNQK